MFIARVLSFLFIVLFAACDRASLDIPTSEVSAGTEKTGLENCSISPLEEEDFLAQIDCPDGSSLKIPRHRDGVDGVNGTSCSVDSVPDGAFIHCEDGSQAFVRNGVDGHSCQVEPVDQYASLIKCSDGSNSLIDLNSHIQSQQTEVIDPCGDNPGKFDEVILRFGTGELIAYFEKGSTRFLTRLAPGNYQTTDQQKCRFKVEANGNVVDL